MPPLVVPPPLLGGEGEPLGEEGGLMLVVLVLVLVVRDVLGLDVLGDVVGGVGLVRLPVVVVVGR